MTLDEIRKLILEEINFYKTENNEKLIDIKLEMDDVASKRKVLEQ